MVLHTKNLIPEIYEPSPNYFCTWHSQQYFHPVELLKKNASIYAKMDPQRHTATMLNESTIFGENGLAHTLFPKHRKDLFFVLDDGWDVPIENPIRYYGSLILDTDKFPSFTGTPQERLKKINLKFQELGWRGAGLWIAAQESPAIMEQNSEIYDDDDFDGDEEDFEPKYWVERMKWMDFAQIKYWKIDWGTMAGVQFFRQMITRLARKYAPKLLIEHAQVFGPLNEPNGVLHDSIIQQQNAFIPSSDVFRLYDVTGQLQIPTMLERAAHVLANFSQTKIQSLLNCEVIPYMAAALGMTIGIMRHPHKNQFYPEAIITEGVERSPNILRESNEADIFTGPPLNMDKRMREIIRCLNWHKIAPAYSVGEGRTDVSEEYLHDEWDLRTPPVWYSQNLKGPTIQKAPAIVLRRLNFEQISIENRKAGQEKLPYLIASLHPNGSLSIGILGRTSLQDGYITPSCSLTIKDAKINQKIGVFGKVEEITILIKQTQEVTQKPLHLWAQDLCSSEAKEISDQCSITQNQIHIPKATIESICEQFNEDDLSDPGFVIQMSRAQ